MELDGDGAAVGLFRASFRRLGVTERLQLRRLCVSRTQGTGDHRPNAADAASGYTGLAIRSLFITIFQ